MVIDRSGNPPYVEQLKSRLIKVQEKGRSACFRNPDRMPALRVRIDGGLISDGPRADFVVSLPNVVDVIVELKGTDTSRGIEQIRATLPIWKKHGLAGRVFGALIVRSQGIHPKHQANIQRWITQFELRYRMTLLIETRNREYDFEEFSAHARNK